MESLYGCETGRDLRSACRCVALFLLYFIFERAAWGDGGGGRCQAFYFVLFSLFRRPRAGLATVQCSFFGLATNTLNMRDNNNNNEVANSTRGHLNRGFFPLFPFTPENLVSRDGFAISAFQANMLSKHPAKRKVVCRAVFV